MSDDYQIEIPQSFLALYTDTRRNRLHTPWPEVVQRYELCEDLANLLTTTARDMEFSLGITESDVLSRVHQGLLGEAAVVTPAEAQWVVCRLAELLGWALPL
nr:ATPase with chaperone activity [uncultured Rhodoferax sp.]